MHALERDEGKVDIRGLFRFLFRKFGRNQHAVVVQGASDLETIQKSDELGIVVMRKQLPFQQHWKVGEVQDAIPDVRVYLAQCHYSCHQLTKPLGVNEVEVLKILIGVVIV